VVQADLAIESDVPMGAGLSSSAALEVATVAALARVARHDLEPAEIARIAHRAEAEFVGVPCGIMDQVASALGVDDSALLIDCRSGEVESVPLGLETQGLALVVVESGVSRRLAGSAYLERREECREACRFLRGPLSRPVGSLREVTLEDLALVGDQLPRTLLRKARHVVSENRRVLDFVSALRDQDIEEAGALMAVSHRSLRDDFEVSTPELDLLVELAARTRGTIGARLTGAGFGGCTVNLVHAETISYFQAAVVDEYIRRTGRKARMHVFRPVVGVRFALPAG
jgi:galactokinase